MTKTYTIMINVQLTASDGYEEAAARFVTESIRQKTVKYLNNEPAIKSWAIEQSQQMKEEYFKNEH